MNFRMSVCFVILVVIKGNNASPLLENSTLIVEHQSNHSVIKRDSDDSASSEMCNYNCNTAVGEHHLKSGHRHLLPAIVVGIDPKNRKGNKRKSSIGIKRKDIPCEAAAKFLESLLRSEESDISDYSSVSEEEESDHLHNITSSTEKSNVRYSKKPKKIRKPVNPTYEFTEEDEDSQQIDLNETATPRTEYKKPKQKSKTLEKKDEVKKKQTPSTTTEKPTTPRKFKKVTRKTKTTPSLDVTGETVYRSYSVVKTKPTPSEAITPKMTTLGTAKPTTSRPKDKSTRKVKPTKTIPTETTTEINEDSDELSVDDYSVPDVSIDNIESSAIITTETHETTDHLEHLSQVKSDSETDEDESSETVTVTDPDTPNSFSVRTTKKLKPKVKSTTQTKVTLSTRKVSKLPTNGRKTLATLPVSFESEEDDTKDRSSEDPEEDSTATSYQSTTVSKTTKQHTASTKHTKPLLTTGNMITIPVNAHSGSDYIDSPAVTKKLSKKPQNAKITNKYKPTISTMELPESEENFTTESVEVPLYSSGNKVFSTIPAASSTHAREKQQRRQKIILPVITNKPEESLIEESDAATTQKTEKQVTAVNKPKQTTIGPTKKSTHSVTEKVTNDYYDSEGEIKSVEFSDEEEPEEEPQAILESLKSISDYTFSSEENEDLVQTTTETSDGIDLSTEILETPLLTQITYNTKDRTKSGSKSPRRKKLPKQTSYRTTYEISPVTLTEKPSVEVSTLVTASRMADTEDLTKLQPKKKVQTKATPKAKSKTYKTEITSEVTTSVTKSEKHRNRHRTKPKTKGYTLETTSESTYPELTTLVTSRIITKAKPQPTAHTEALLEEITEMPISESKNSEDEADESFIDVSVPEDSNEDISIYEESSEDVSIAQEDDADVSDHGSLDFYERGGDVSDVTPAFESRTTASKRLIPCSKQNMKNATSCKLHSTDFLITQYPCNQNFSKLFPDLNVLINNTMQEKKALPIVLALAPVSYPCRYKNVLDPCSNKVTCKKSQSLLIKVIRALTKLDIPIQQLLDAVKSKGSNKNRKVRDIKIRLLSAIGSSPSPVLKTN